MAIEDDIVQLRGRMAALEFVTIMQTLVEAASKPNFDPVEFAERQSAAWAQMGAALNDDYESPGGAAFQKALEDFGKLLTAMAEPVDKAMKGLKESGA